MKHHAPEKGRLRLWLVVVLWTALASPARGGSEPVRVTFETFGGEVVVPVSINGSRVLNCILDTGMTPGVFVMDPATGEELGLDYTGTVMVGGAGEGDPQYARVAAGVDLEIAGANFSGQPALVLEEYPDWMDSRFDGIVGKTVFDAFVVEIDFDSCMVLLHDPAGFDTTGAGVGIPIEISNMKPFVNGTVRIGNSHEIPVSLVVDLGAGHALSLNRAQKPRLPSPDRTINTLLGTGLKGDIFGEQGRVRSLAIGPFEMPGVVASFPDNTDEAGLGPYARNGNLGLGVLKRFRVAFDYGNGRMYLRPNRRYGIPFEEDMAGLALRQGASGGVTVYYVRKYSPAFKAGVEKGDAVLQIDGRPAADWDDVSLEDLFQREGETVSLLLRRGERELAVTITLERQI